jgi:hypothetical protein
MIKTKIDTLNSDLEKEDKVKEEYNDASDQYETKDVPNYALWNGVCENPF